MNAKSYSFQVGSLECFALLDGALILGAEKMMARFPNGDEAAYRQAYADMGLSFDEADSGFIMLAAKIGDEVVLIDTGMGGAPGGLLIESMALAGIQPEDITTVVLTHTHGDHVMGILSGDGQPNFPNATYVISREEMEFWQARIDGDAAMQPQQAMIDMMREKGLRLIAMDEEIVPGLTAVPIPGHTPGQIALLIESVGERFIHLADLLHSPMQFAHPEWSPRFDADTSISVPVRKDMLVRAADDNLLTLFYHLTFPGLGRVRREGENFRWEPIKA